MSIGKWVAALQRAMEKPADSVFNFAVANFTMANELELMATYIITEMEMDSHGGLEVTIRQTESKKKLPNNFVKQTPECSS